MFAGFFQTRLKYFYILIAYICDIYENLTNDKQIINKKPCNNYRCQTSIYRMETKKQKNKKEINILNTSFVIGLYKQRRKE